MKNKNEVIYMTVIDFSKRIGRNPNYVYDRLKDGTFEGEKVNGVMHVKTREGSLYAVYKFMGEHRALLMLSFLTKLQANRKAAKMNINEKHDFITYRVEELDKEWNN